MATPANITPRKVVDMSTPAKKTYLVVVRPNCKLRTAQLSPEKYGLIVTVVVGSGIEKKTFLVYEGLLKYHSSYFEAALKSAWAESVTKTINLPEDSPEVFQVFFNWLMSGRLCHNLDAQGKLPLSMRLIMKAYVFGDARGAPDFCNEAVDLFFQKYFQDRVFPDRDLNYLYDNTLWSSRLRKLVVTIAVDHHDFLGSGNTSFHPSDVYPKNFLIEAFVLFKARQKIPFPKHSESDAITYTKNTLCNRFHDHSKANVKGGPAA